MAANLPEALGGAGAAVIDGRLIVVGGEGRTSAFTDVYAYDLTARSWTRLPDLPQGRHGLAVAAIGTILYAIDGATQPGHNGSTNTVEALIVPRRPAQPKGGWQPRQASLVSVQQVGAAVVGDRIWVAGGLTSEFQDTAKTEVYDPTLDAWQSGPPLPYPVNHAMMVAYQNRPVVIGGFVSNGIDALAATTDRVLTLKGNRWVDLPKLNHPRGAGAAAVVGNKIIVVGGQTGRPEQLVTQTEVYDGTGWQDAAPIPVPGDHLAATSDGTYLYAVGGRKFVASNNTRALRRYDPNTDTWTTLPSAPSTTVKLNLRLPRELHATLTEQAAADHRSLNSLIIVLLERAVESVAEE